MNTNGRWDFIGLNVIPGMLFHLLLDMTDNFHSYHRFRFATKIYLPKLSRNIQYVSVILRNGIYHAQNDVWEIRYTRAIH